MCDLVNWPDFYSEKQQVARKGHNCYACHESIRSGDRYVRIVGVWEGQFDHFKHCLRCSAMMLELGQLTGEVVDIALDCGNDPLEPGTEIDELAFISRDEAQATLLPKEKP